MVGPYPVAAALLWPVLFPACPLLSPASLSTDLDLAYDNSSLNSPGLGHPLKLMHAIHPKDLAKRCQV